MLIMVPHRAVCPLGTEENFKQAFMPLLPGIRHIRFGIEEDLKMISVNTAAVFIETVQGEAGIQLHLRRTIKS